jgi:hypothetical protein
VDHFAKTLAAVNSRLPEIFSPAFAAVCCKDAGHRWRRSGPLLPWMTLLFFAMQVLKGNSACADVRMMGAGAFTATAYCKARKRLPLAVFEAILDKIASLATSRTPDTWRGWRVFFADGTGCSMPDSADLRKHFGLPSGTKKGIGFPVVHMLHLMDAATGMVRKVFIGPWRQKDRRPQHFLRRSATPEFFLCPTPIVGTRPATRALKVSDCPCAILRNPSCDPSGRQAKKRLVSTGFCPVRASTRG